MKNLITLLNLSIIFGITAIFTVPNKSDNNSPASSTPQAAMASSVTKSPEASVERRVAFVKETHKLAPAIAANDLDFITRSVEVCLIKLEEGKIAQQQGNLKAIKHQGSAMIADQSEMLADLKKIAVRKSIITSADMPDNYFALEDLRQLHGDLFDKRFVKKMLYNYKREVRDLERATRSKDADVQVFATKYLPVMQAHLTRIKSLKKKL